MAERDRTEIPHDIEQALAALSELGNVLGTASAAATLAMTEELRKAMAARDRGDVIRALDHTARAMTLVAEATAKLDPNEAGIMRAIVDRFRAALQRCDAETARRLVDKMFERSGARWKKG